MLWFCSHAGWRWANNVSCLLAGHRTRPCHLRVLREGVFHAETHRAVNCPKASRRVVSVLGRRRLDAWRQADWWCRRYPAVRRRRRRRAARDPRCRGSADGWTRKRDRSQHRRILSRNPSQHIWARNHKSRWRPLACSLVCLMK